MNRHAELPRLEDADEADLQMAIEAMGPLAHYGGFLRAALAGIMIERQRHTVACVEASQRDAQ